MTWKGIDSQALAAAGVHIDRAGCAIVPYRGSDGRLHAVRVHDPRGRCWWRGRGVRLIPFGLEQIRPGPGSVLLLVEGESDALCCRQHSELLARILGVDRVDALGVPGASTWKPEWAEHLVGYGRVFVLGDGDNAGRLMNANVVRDTPGAIAVWAMPAGCDVRAVVQEHGVEELAGLLLDAADLARAYDAILASATVEECETRLRAGRAIAHGD